VIDAMQIEKIDHTNWVYVDKTPWVSYFISQKTTFIYLKTKKIINLLA